MQRLRTNMLLHGHKSCTMQVKPLLRLVRLPPAGTHRRAAAAVKIQSCVRMKLAKIRCRQLSSHRRAAVKLQAAARRFVGYRKGRAWLAQHRALAKQQLHTLQQVSDTGDGRGPHYLYAR